MERMYKNHKNKLDYFKRLGVAKLLLSRWSVARIARKFGISRQTVYEIERKFVSEGVMGLQDHRPGVLGGSLNHATDGRTGDMHFYDKYLDRQKYGMMDQAKLSAFV